jgi:DHA2 family multidrug resistance protein
MSSDLDKDGTLNRPLVTASIMLATVLQALDTTIANVALPHMQASLGATRESVTWVLTSYIVASAVATPASGWLADRFGLKNMLMFGIAGFVISSMLCGIAASLTAMVIFRIAQGAIGAFLIPISQTVMLGIYPKEKHAQAISIWGMAIMVSPIMGPILGGWLTDNFSWRWVFYVNLPLGLLSLIGVLISVPKWKQQARKFDLFGFIMLSIAILALQTLLDRGASKDWFESWEIVIEAGIAAAALWVFIVHSATARTRLFEPQLLADRNYTTAIFFTTLVMALVTGGAALLPPMLQQLFGYSTITAGELMAPRGTGTFISMIFVGQLSRHVDLRLLLLIGLSLVTVSLYMMTGFSLEMGTWPVITSGFIQGLGLGLCMVPNNLLAFQSIPAEVRTDASALYNLIRSLGGSVGVSFVTTILAKQVQVSHSDMAANVTSSSLLGLDNVLAVGANRYMDAAASMIDLEINRQALMVGYLDDFWLLTILTLCSLPLLLLIRRPKPLDGAQETPVMAD